MPRPKCCRRIAGPPGSRMFGPREGGPGQAGLSVLELDELEAIRLADLEGLYQEQAAEHMGVSRQTFGRIVATARRKVAKALVEGTLLRVEGGVVPTPMQRTFGCGECATRWDVPYGTGKPARCPHCGTGGSIKRVGAGWRGGCCGGRGKGATAGETRNPKEKGK